MDLKEALTKYGYALLVTLLLAGTVVLSHPVYYCEGNDPLLRECIKLSSSGRTCYFETGRDLCSSGVWTKIEGNTNSLASNTVKVKANNKEWICEVNDGYLNSYTKCTSDAYNRYLGELI